jgi:hypothetical protein
MIEVVGIRWTRIRTSVREADGSARALVAKLGSTQQAVDLGAMLAQKGARKNAGVGPGLDGAEGRVVLAEVRGSVGGGRTASSWRRASLTR